MSKVDLERLAPAWFMFQDSAPPRDCAVSVIDFGFLLGVLLIIIIIA